MPQRTIEVAGERFGRLVAIVEVELIIHAGRKRRAYFCVCDCGGTTIARLYALTWGQTTSCGCKRKESAFQRLYKHGHALSGVPNRTYNTWRAMLQRCYDPNFEKYPQYGARGITVHIDWRGEHGFENFLRDMGERPDGKTLDRYPDNDGNYEPTNCRWATPKEQNQNRKWREYANN